MTLYYSSPLLSRVRRKPFSFEKTPWIIWLCCFFSARRPPPQQIVVTASHHHNPIDKWSPLLQAFDPLSKRRGRRCRHRQIESFVCMDTIIFGCSSIINYTAFVVTMTMPSTAATTSQQSTNNRNKSMRSWRWWQWATTATGSNKQCTVNDKRKCCRCHRGVGKNIIQPKM
jgi:hypothetical protein